MTDICFYFQVHQPYRLKKYTVFEIGTNPLYYDDTLNKEIAQRVSKDSYLPTNKLILKAINESQGAFKVAYSLSGIALEQLEEYAPEVIQSFQNLAKTGCVEFLAETYYHSLAGIYSKEEFIKQINKHRQKIKELFDQEPVTFRNTELVLTQDIIETVKELGFTTILGEGARIILEKESPDHVFESEGLKLLLRNYERSDDIAFRFSDKEWEGWPLSPKKFLKKIPKDAEIVNLFMDYETFGEHQKKKTGIFDFMELLPITALKEGFSFVTPKEVVKPTQKELEIPCPVSWADSEKDLSAWMGNKMQVAALHNLYNLEKDIIELDDKEILQTWRVLQCSDQFYYMCIKWFNDGDVHKYFSPYDSPYDAFIAFMNILNDLVIRVKSAKKVVQHDP